MKRYEVKEDKPNIVSDFMPSYGSPVTSLTAKMARVRAGVDMLFLKALSKKLGIGLQEMSVLLHVSLRTLQRYDDHDKLNTDLSSKLLVLHELYLHGDDVMGQEAFANWIKVSSTVLGGVTPLSVLDNPFGIKQVDDVLGRIEYGVFA